MSEVPIDTSWDFKTANTKDYTHCFHGYPAMMIPQIARRLIGIYGQNARNLLDPYCGTGTSLVEANLQGINAFGTDLNPLACLIAQTKTSKINIRILDCYIDEFNTQLSSRDFMCSEKTSPTCPEFKNIDFWFKKDAKEKLALIKNFIDNMEDEKSKNFFKVAFSETVRDVSLTRNKEFKLYRMTSEQIAKFKPNVWGIFVSKLERNRQGLDEFLSKRHKTHISAKIYNCDSTNTLEPIENEIIDLIVTSPPYGDSRTTVAYGQFSRLANQWLGFENAFQIDNNLMGGKSKDIEKTNFSSLDETVKKIEKKDAKRARDVFSFYVDYANSIKNVAQKVKKGGYACYVVGNRRVKDTILPTNQITREIFEAHNFQHITSYIRKIPNKRMPSLNSPTNAVGKKSATMTNEYIVVMQKLGSPTST